MTYFESLSFVYRLVLARLDILSLVYAFLAFDLTLILGHWFWGRMWNRRWNFSLAPGITIISITIALLLSITTLFWFAADRSMTWVEHQRTELKRQFTESGTRNRRIFRAAQLHIMGVENPSENVLMLRTERDALMLALTAANDVSCPLTNYGPLGPGAPCRVRDATTVAEEVIREIPTTTYPITVSPQNPWVEAAVLAQLDEALNYAVPRLRTGMAECKKALIVIGLFSAFLQIMIVAYGAIRDIRIDPNVKQDGVS